MFIRLLSCVFFLFFSVILFGQTGGSKKVFQYYKISPEETLELLSSKDFDPDFKYFHTQLTLPKDSLISDSELPPGNYLRVSNQYENMEIELRLKNTTKVDLINAEKYLYFNPVNVPLDDKASAKIWLDGKLLKWHGPTQHFRWKKKKRKKKLKMVARIGDQVVYQSLDQKYKHRRRGNFWRKLNPNGLPRRISYRIRNMGRNIGNRIEKIKDPDYGGYMVLNKPEYRPGDTLKMKAYLVDKKGRFPKGPVKLRNLKYGFNSKNLVELYPDKNGNIVYELILHDSLELELDRNYYLSFSNKNLRKFNRSFRFKDYQLDEVKYDFKLKKPRYYYGDTISFLANGFYKNGLRVKDAKVKIQVLIPENTANYAQASSFYADMVVIENDTLWTYEQALDTEAPTEITVPDSVWPAANFRYQVISTFTNTNGEIQTKKTSIQLSKNWKPKEAPCFSVSIDSLDLVVQNNCTDRPDLDQVIMQARKNNNPFEREKINLPYRKKIDGGGYWWQFFIQDTIMVKSFSSGKENALVKVFGEHVGDSIYVYVKNPHGLPLLWEWYENKKLKTAATTIPDGVFFARKANPDKSYYLKYFYRWNGYYQDQTIPLQFYKNQLEMKVSQPTIIQPGETVRVKVKIKDDKGKDAANVNLTALSINDQFKNTYVNGPKIKIGPFKKPKEKPNYRTSSREKIKRKKINKDWVQKMDLEEELFYKIRYPKKGLLLHYEKIEGDSFYQNITQFAPYIVNNGEEQPILMIKANRKLVYYYDVDDNPPYSFINSSVKIKRQFCQNLIFC